MRPTFPPASMYKRPWTPAERDRLRDALQTWSPDGPDKITKESLWSLCFKLDPEFPADLLSDHVGPKSDHIDDVFMWLFPDNSTKSAPQIAQSRKILLLVGPTASGKDTLADQLVEQTSLPKVAVHNILRELKHSRAPESELEREILAKGKKNTGDVDMLNLVKARTAKPDCAQGFILVSWPNNTESMRLVNQWLESIGEPLSLVLCLNVSCVEVLQNRVGGRFVHVASGRSYHVDANPPRSMAEPGALMLDDVTGEALERRADDVRGLQELEGKWAKFQNDLLPMVNELRRTPWLVHEIDAEQPLQQVFATAAGLVANKMP